MLLWCARRLLAAHRGRRRRCQQGCLGHARVPAAARRQPTCEPPAATRRSPRLSELSISR